MGKDPAVLFYTSDFMSGVVGLTMQERGQYISLLCIQHQQGHLSEKTICLSLGIASVSEIPDVMAKFTVDNCGKFYNERMDFEAEKRHKYVETRKENAKLGGRPKKENTEHKEMHTNNHMDIHMENHMGNEIEYESEDNIENEDAEKIENNGDRFFVQTPSPKAVKDAVEKVIDECLLYLNTVSGKSFKITTESNRKFVRARINEDYTMDDFKRVIDNQWLKWKDTDMEEYMRPSTLFNAEKFQSYINAPDYSKQAVPKYQNKAGRFEQIDFDKIEV